METVVLTSLIVLAVSIIGILVLLALDSFALFSQEQSPSERQSIDVDTSACPAFVLTGDGVCDDVANNIDCGFDSGDCCLPFIDDQSCESCICSKDETRHLSKTCQKPDWLGDGLCDENLNNFQCQFDLGDCCLPSNSTAELYCDDCTCRERKNSASSSLCPKEYLTKDEFCDDETNTEECNYDGGSCCLPTIDWYYCESCICHIDEKKHGPNSIVGSSSSAGICWNYKRIGDGFCDDDLNVEGCNYDEGDCCMEKINVDDCFFCLCKEDGTRHPTNHNLGGCHLPLFVRDGQCDDVTNIPECRYDGGDCCEITINADVCLDCICHRSGTMHSAYKEYFTENYYY